MDILRVISGQAKGHKLKTIDGNSTRPTSDRVKESLFNIITSYILDADVLDLYAGTGNLGIEALSRGAASAVFVDKSRECFEVIKDNLNHTKLENSALVITGEVITTLNKLSMDNKKFDIIFLDQQYNKNLIQETLKVIDKNDIINDNGIVIAEKDVVDIIPEEVGRLKLTRNQKYGDTVLSFYKKI
jgi:16S rRNA (guanine966-N2)-methyltransferase